MYIKKQKVDETHLWKGKKFLLGKLDIELTERCNNNCLHCYINLPADDKVAKEKELSDQGIKNILKESASLGCMTVRFTGGEPLLREDFKELYIYARKLGLKVMLFTNATLITPELAELFCRIPLLEKIEVSVYGMKKNSYEAITRVPGSFEAAWRGINLLLDKKIPFVVKGALLPANKAEREEFNAWAQKIPWMDNINPTHSGFFDLRCRRDDVEKNELIKKIRLRPEEHLDNLSKNKIDKESYIKEKREFCSKFMYPSGGKVFSCGSGLGEGCVDAYGKFQPCMLVRHPDVVYDLKNGSLKDALENFFPKIRETKAANSDYLARCTKCFLRGLCEQCPGKSWEEHGTLDTPVEYFCEVAHAKARFLSLIKEEEKAWEVVDWKERVGKFTGKQIK